MRIIRMFKNDFQSETAMWIHPHIWASWMQDSIFIELLDRGDLDGPKVREWKKLHPKSLFIGKVLDTYLFVYDLEEQHEIA